MGAYNKQDKQQCRKCGKYCHKLGNKRCPENKNGKEENNKKTEKYENKTENLMGVLPLGPKGHVSKDCWAQKYGHHKKFGKAERVIDGDENDIVLCSLTKENKKDNTKKKVLFMEDVKQPSEADMMCTIDGDSFFCSQRIPGLETQVHHAISPMTILAYMTSLTLTSPSKVAPVLYLLQRRANYR